MVESVTHDQSVSPANTDRPRIMECIVCRGRRLHYLFSVSDYRIVRCDDCGLLLTNPQPSADELARIYTADYFLRSTTDAGRQVIPELKQLTADLYLDLLDRYGASNSCHLLEIGCGEGDFLLRARKRGFTVTGVEYSEHACAVARNKLSMERGWDVSCGEIDDIPAEAIYDVCVLSDVIEHVRNPRSLLERVHELLRPGGIILVATPALNSWSARVLRSKWMEFKVEHLFYFNSSTLQSLLIDCGFAEIIERKGVKVLNFDYIAEHFERYKVGGISPLLNLLHRIAPARLRHKPFEFVASGMVQLARKAEKSISPRLSIVVPVFNEARSFSAVFQRLLEKKVEGLDTEIIVVESNSTDGTREQVLQFADHPRVKLLLEPEPRGKGHAVRAGLKEITGNFVMIQDADLEYDLEDYEALLEPLLRNRAAFVLGARHGGSTWKMRQFEHQPIVAMILNAAHWFFTALINLFFNASLKDPFTMYKVFRRDCLYGLRFTCDRFDFDWELVIKFLLKGYHPIEIPVNYRSRSFAEGKKVSIVRDPFTWLRVLAKLRLKPIDLLQEIEQARHNGVEPGIAPSLEKTSS
jgi:SAM-dependent methyltransferase